MGPMWNAIFSAISPEYTNMNIGTNVYQTGFNLVAQLNHHDNKPNNMSTNQQVIAVTHSNRAAHFHKSNGFTQMTPKLIPYEDDGEVKFLVHVLKHRPCYVNSSLGESDKIEQKSSLKSNGQNVDKNTAVGAS